MYHMTGKKEIFMVCFLSQLSERDYDPEQFADQELPILIVGTKLVGESIVCLTRTHAHLSCLQWWLIIMFLVYQ